GGRAGPSALPASYRRKPAARAGSGASGRQLDAESHVLRRAQSGGRAVGYSGAGGAVLPALAPLWRALASSRNCSAGRNLSAVGIFSAGLPPPEGLRPRRVGRRGPGDRPAPPRPAPPRPPARP